MVVLELNGRDYSEWVEDFKVTTSYEYPTVLTAMDGTEYYGKPFIRESITFKLYPMRGDYAHEFHSIFLSNALTVKYISPNLGLETTSQMKVTTNLEHSHFFESMEGEEFYSGESITLRSTNTIRV